MGQIVADYEARIRLLLNSEQESKKSAAQSLLKLNAMDITMRKKLDYIEEEVHFICACLRIHTPSPTLSHLLYWRSVRRGAQTSTGKDAAAGARLSTTSFGRRGAEQAPFHRTQGY